MSSQVINKIRNTYYEKLQILEQMERIYNSFTDYSTLVKFQYREEETPTQRLKRYECFYHQCQETIVNYCSEMKNLGCVEIFSEFGLSIDDMTTINQCSINTLKKYLKQLEDKNLIKLIKIGRRNYYSARLENIQ